MFVQPDPKKGTSYHEVFTSSHYVPKRPAADGLFHQKQSIHTMMKILRNRFNIAGLLLFRMLAARFSAVDKFLLVGKQPAWVQGN